LIRTSSHLSHPLGISLISSFSKGSSQKGSHLNCFPQTHVVAENASFLVNETLVEELNPGNLIIAKVLRN
jgi:hypothetical protein